MSEQLKTLAAAYAEAKLAFDAAGQKLEKAQDEYYQVKAAKSNAFYAFNKATDSILENACINSGAAVDRISI